MAIVVMTLNPISVNVSWDYEEGGYPGNSKDINSQSYTSPQLTIGTGAGQANIKYSAQLTLASGANTTLVLNALTDNFGNSISFARIKEIYIENSASDGATSISVGGAGSNAFNAIWSTPGTALDEAYITILNGVCFNVGVAKDAIGYVVGSNINLKITNNDGAHAALINVVIVGCNV